MTVEHARAAKLGEHSGVLCAAGIRSWMDRHELNLRQFLDEGLPVEQFEALDDAFAQRLAAIAREEASRG
ncbi:hypothetical protein [Stenotrophomonas maltophilia]|uniref:hypothetical protein n=1 Tax=Stenotrophomonas maltophilia TaxID=40324 RepID=UPI001EF7DB18|nr:hypothetical protein [Stenotrophomonas maltophilia]